MFAVIKTGGKQYRVRVGDRISVERLASDDGIEITIDRVLLLGGDGSTRVGTPTVAGAKVTATILENKRGEKVIVFKKKKRKGMERKRGHRQELSVIKINSIKA